MGDFCCKKDVFVIKGDVLEVYFELDGIPRETVKEVVFNCDCADIHTCCPFSEERGGYCLRIRSEDTELHNPCIGSYDLVVEFIDGEFLTVVHEGLFAVLKRRNDGTEVANG